MSKTESMRVLAFGQVGGHADGHDAEGGKFSINGLAMGPTRFLKKLPEQPAHRDWHGCLVIDKLHVLRRRPTLAWVAPMVDPRLAPNQRDRFKLENPEDTLILAALANGDQFQRAFAALAVASANHEGSESTAFDYVDPLTFSAWWKSRGARIGVLLCPEGEPARISWMPR
jgi:hypothetical protein